MELIKTGHQPDESTFKFKFKKQSKVKTIKSIRLEHVGDGHDKYYLMDIEEWNIKKDQLSYKLTKTFGKNGSIGGTKSHVFSTYQGAVTFVEKKLVEQLKKGYKIIHNNINKTI